VENANASVDKFARTVLKRCSKHTVSGATPHGFTKGANRGMIIVYAKTNSSTKETLSRSRTRLFEAHVEPRRPKRA
jgi:hypothetical protein